MKKVVVLLIASLLLPILFVSPSYAVATKLYVDPLSVTAGRVGKLFNITVSVAGVTNLYGFEFKLSYNTTLLNATAATLGPFFPSPPKSHVVVDLINNTAGYVWFAATLLAPEPPRTGTGALATITFNTTYGTIYPQTVGCDLHLYETILGDQTSQPIGHDTIDGYYAFVPIQGDINGDGVVNIKDMVIVGAAFGSKPGDPNWDPCADINNDGYVNILDAIIVGINFGATG